MKLAVNIKSDYFYNIDANQFSYIRIPKLLMLGEDFSSLSLSAEILYGMLLDEMYISVKNKWIDKQTKRSRSTDG